MKKISIISILLTTLFFSGCGSDGSSSQTIINTIKAGETKTLVAGTTITAYSGTCSPSIVVQTNGSWTVTNVSTNSNDICQYN
jgi:ABC-type Fe3+-hydroxamate transport system substrate-binding protein